MKRNEDARRTVEIILEGRRIAISILKAHIASIEMRRMTDPYRDWDQMEREFEEQIREFEFLQDNNLIHIKEIRAAKEVQRR